MAKFQVEVAVYSTVDGNSYHRIFRVQDYTEAGTVSAAFEHGITKAMADFEKQFPTKLEEK